MSIQLNPYLSFRDNTKEVMEFYQWVFGGELTISTFAEFHASDDPGEQDKIMHSMLTTDGGLVLMASDTPNRMDYTPGNNFSMSLSGHRSWANFVTRSAARVLPSQVLIPEAGGPWDLGPWPEPARFPPRRASIRRHRSHYEAAPPPSRSSRCGRDRLNRPLSALPVAHQRLRARRAGGTTASPASGGAARRPP
jgi:PhnB protein